MWDITSFTKGLLWSIFADFGIDQVFILSNEKGKKQIQVTENISIWNCKIFARSIKKTNTKTRKLLYNKLQTQVIPISLIEMIFFKKQMPQDNDLFHPDLSLIKNPSLFEKNSDSDGENLQLQTNHETYPPARKYSLTKSYSSTNVFQTHIQIQRILSISWYSIKKETILKYQKRDRNLKILQNWPTQKSHSVTKTPLTTASPFLLEYYRFFPKHYSDEHAGLITIQNQFLKHYDKLPQYTDDNLFSLISCGWLCFTLHLTKFMNLLMLVCILPNMNSTNINIFHFCKIVYHFWFMFALIAEYETKQSCNFTISILVKLFNRSISKDTGGPIFLPLK